MLFHYINKTKYANGVVNMIYFRLVCTVSPVAAIMTEARNTITGYSIPDFCNWNQAGRGEDEGDDPPTLCENVTG